MKIKEVLNYLELRFPYDLAEDFDFNKIGLTIGNPENEVSGILCSLDLTLEAIEEAIDKKCNLIVSHHPFAFSPITKVLENDEKGALIYKMVKNDISLIAMHTNMDLGLDGVNDTLCLMLQLKESNYGINEKKKYIRHGYIEEKTLRELANEIKSILSLDGVKVVGDLNTKITKIGILGGSGGQEYEINSAVNFGCQCYITGEIKHHIALYSKFKNICLIEVDHGIEKFVFNKLSKDLRNEFSVNVFVSEINSNLFTYL